MVKYIHRDLLLKLSLRTEGVVGAAVVVGTGAAIGAIKTGIGWAFGGAAIGVIYEGIKHGVAMPQLWEGVIKGGTVGGEWGLILGGIGGGLIGGVTYAMVKLKRR